jgi:hypothetical protein
MLRFSLVNRFFTTLPNHNLSALTKRPLEFFIRSLPSPATMMNSLKKQGYFPKQTALASSKTVASYLQEDGFDYTKMQATPAELLAEPLQLAFTGGKFSALNKPYKPLIPLLNSYVATIVAVFGDRLAKRPYDPKEQLNENTTERGHAFEAFVIAHHLRARDKNKFAVLALQHDIARSTVADVHYGDRNHHEEADRILEPQGYSHTMATRFPLLHPFAKYLWAQYSLPYREELLSPVSAYSLTVQHNAAAAMMRQLDELYYSPDPQLQAQKSEELAVLILRMMVLRLVDDAAKVALPEAEYLLTPEQLDRLITEQLVAHIHTLSSGYCGQYKESLANALTLLRRTKLDSNYPERYQAASDENTFSFST